MRNPHSNGRPTTALPAAALQRLADRSPVRIMVAVANAFNDAANYNAYHRSPPYNMISNRRGVPAWSKIVELDCAISTYIPSVNEGHPRSGQLDSGLLKLKGLPQQRDRPLPPMAPSHFTKMLRDGTITFTNGADAPFVRNLYRRTLEDGFGSMSVLKYSNSEWGDVEVEKLGTTLCEVACTYVRQLHLDQLGEGRGLAEGRLCYGASPISPGPLGLVFRGLPLLQYIDLRGARTLTALPAEIGRLVHLQAMHLSGCEKILTLPEEMTALRNLASLQVQGCFSLGWHGMPDFSHSVANGLRFNCYSSISLLGFWIEELGCKKADAMTIRAELGHDPECECPACDCPECRNSRYALDAAHESNYFSISSASEESPPEGWHEKYQEYARSPVTCPTCSTTYDPYPAYTA